MSRGYRGIILAAVGWLILATSAPSPQWQIEQAKAEQRQADALEQINARAAQQANSTVEDEGCQDRKDRRSSDLCAQWKAADSAAEAAIWTRKTYYLTLVGTASVVAALLLALWSNRIALRAVDADSRPWLHPVSFVCKPFFYTADVSGGVLNAELLIKNTGKTAAANISVGWILLDDIENKGLKFWHSPMLNASIENVLPGENAKVPITHQFQSTGPDGSPSLQFLALRIIYTGPGQRKRRMSWQFWHFGDSIFHGTMQPFREDWFTSKNPPVARVMFTVRMT